MRRQEEGAGLPARESQKSLRDALARGIRPADDEDGVLSGDRAEHIRAAFGVDRLGNGLRTRDDGLHDYEFAHEIEPLEQLRYQRRERRAILRRRRGVGGGVANTAGSRHARHAKGVHVARKRGLRDLPAAFGEQLPELFLAADGACPNELPNHLLAFPFLAHRISPGYAGSGVTGAGFSARTDLLFGEVTENFRAYGTGNTHRDLNEMRAMLSEMGADVDLLFTPHLLPTARGILATMTVPLARELPRVLDPWSKRYANEPFIELVEEPPELRHVAHRNVARIAVMPVAHVRTPTQIGRAH